MPQESAPAPQSEPDRGTTDNEAVLTAIRGVVAGGSSSNMRARGMIEPLVAIRAQGSRVWDATGRELIDVNMGYGPHIFGYADPRWAEDVARQLHAGAMTGIPHVLDREAAGLIAQMVPSIEQVRFANSGTEALMSAARLARMSTGRTLVVTFEAHYHGWSETLLRRFVLPGSRPANLEPGPEPGAPGMIPEAMAHTLQLPWNDPAAIDAAFERHGDRIAAVFCEPVLGNAGVVPPQPGFLEKLRELTSRHGAMLVFDEVITGFRFAADCAQGHYGVVPDLTVLSKVLGGGFPVAAFGGSREVMAPLARLEAFHAGVYSGNHAAMAAVVSMLSRISREQGIYPALEELGAYAEAGVREVFRQAGQPVWIGRVGSLMSVSAAQRDLEPGRETLDGPAATDFDLHKALQIACQDAGVYFHPNPHEPWFLSTKHTRSDLDRVCEALAKALASEA